ncbi:MAG: hypothetical protein ACI845_000998 [Gammaproteobacteria bacterium]|jgi:hypothetical protein
MQELDWNDLRFVLAVARTKSLAAAGRVLGVNESTVGRRIKRAEQKLNALLFERSRGFLIPTRSGQVVIERSERIELEAQCIEQAISGADQSIAGSVRLTSVPIVLHHILVPALPPLLKAYPQLKVERVSDPRDLSLAKRESDVALRLARLTEEVRAIACKVGQLDYAVFSSIKAGLGKSLLPTSIGDKEPGFTRIEKQVCLSREMWIMIHPDFQKLTRIRAVVDCLIVTLANFQAESHRRHS